MSLFVIVLFCGVVFGAVFLLSLGLTTPASGDARMRRVLRRRLERMDAGELRENALVIREKYLQSLSPLEQQLEELPYMEKLTVMIEQAGIPTPGYRIVLASGLFAGLAAIVVGLVTHNALVALAAGCAGGCIPVARIAARRCRQAEGQQKDRAEHDAAEHHDHEQAHARRVLSVVAREVRTRRSAAKPRARSRVDGTRAPPRSPRAGPERSRPRRHRCAGT